jgi:putative NADH-flavin reductase
MPTKPRRAARPAKKTARRGATGARAAARLAERARKAKAPRKPAKKAAKRSARKDVKKVAKKSARKVPKRAAKAAEKAAKRAAPAKQPKPAQPSKKAAPASRPRGPVVEFTEVPHSDRPLRIALFGASGNIGSRIAQEAVRRGHHVTALVRHPERMATVHPNLSIVKGDVTDPVQVEVAARNHDVVASAVAPPMQEMRQLVDAAKSLSGVSRSTGARVVAVGGAGSLEVAPGVQLLDAPQYPQEWRPIGLAHRDALEVFRRQGGDAWTVISPAALIEPGQRTGRFRWGTDQLVADKAGNSRISMEDYAVAFVDELEQGRNRGKRITVGY